LNTDFLKYQAQTSPYPLGMEISHAKGSYIYATNNKKILRFCSRSFCVRWGISLRETRLSKISWTSIRMLWYTENILKAQLWNIASF
jgi:hypothetical protein